MHLNQAQIDDFWARGFLFFERLFSEAEIDSLREALPRLFERHGPEVVRETGDEHSIRLLYGAHRFEEAYRRMSLHPRVLGPVQQLLGEPVYIHQTRLNPKLNFAGREFVWHQDFGSWHRVDDMPEPKAIMTAIFLDDSTAVNSPLLIIPGSQDEGMREDVRPDETVKYVLMEVDRPSVERLARQHGVRALTGPAGSVAFIHCNVVHGSAPNVSPYRRSIWYVNYNAVSNACRGTERGWYQNNRDFTPLEPLADDCLDDLIEKVAAVG